MKKETPKRAAQYLRMSTEHQQYSTENQADAIQVYAALRGYEIAHTYADEGKSGLSIEGRDGLQRLIRDVQTGAAQFDAVIVYDVSRWGRFQDADEAAYYEHICKRAGIAVEYCAEPFQNDGSPLSAVLKGLKRAMAGEYSRELSVKVWAGQKRIVEKGYRHGAAAGYGFRRQAVDAARCRKFDLAHGQQKCVRTDHVILVPGPAEERKVVRWIYKRFLAGATEREIVDDLNARGVLTDHGRPFSRMVVKTILTSEKYAGTHVWNRTSTKLRRRLKRNEPEEWIRVPNAFKGLIDKKMFAAAQVERRARSGRLTDDEILEPLRRLLKKHGYLSYSLIENQGTFPTVGACTNRFGSMRATYARLGYANPKDHSYVEVNQLVRQIRPLVCANIFDALVRAQIAVVPETVDRLMIADEFAVDVSVSRFRTCKDSPRGWHVTADARRHTDFFIVARLDKTNTNIRDYAVLPLRLASALYFHITERREAVLAGYLAGSVGEIPSVLRRVCQELEGRIAT